MALLSRLAAARVPVVAMLCLLILTGRTRAAGEVSLEVAIKATLLYKFAPFIDWPAEQKADLDALAAFLRNAVLRNVVLPEGPTSFAASSRGSPLSTARTEIEAAESCSLITCVRERPDLIRGVFGRLLSMVFK